jgi:hypothetical protein
MMNLVKVKKDELKDKIQTNRDTHSAEYSKAFEGYRRACIQALQTNLQAFHEGRAQRVLIYEQPPEDHTKDYDRVLMMLQMSVDDEVILDASEFAQYVLDDWGWKQPWAASNSKYLDR